MTVLCPLDWGVVCSLVLLSHTLSFPCHIEACFQGAANISTIIFSPLKKDIEPSLTFGVLKKSDLSRLTYHLSNLATLDSHPLVVLLRRDPPHLSSYLYQLSILSLSQAVSC